MLELCLVVVHVAVAVAWLGLPGLASAVAQLLGLRSFDC